jgi:hypothetical protein
LKNARYCRPFSGKKKRNENKLGDLNQPCALFLLDM